MEQKSYMMFLDYLDECEKGILKKIYIIQMIKNNFLIIIVDSKMPNNDDHDNDALQNTDNVCKSSMSTSTVTYTLKFFL